MNDERFEERRPPASDVDAAANAAYRAGEREPADREVALPRDDRADELADMHLLPDEVVQDLRPQWAEIQASFVDAPRRAVEQADKLVSEGHLSKVSAAAGATGGIDSRVVKVDGNRAYINIGSSSGVKVGDKFVIIHRGEEIVDPVTGMKLGAEEKQTGTGVVVEVAERYAIMTVTGKAIAADVIKKQ